MLRNGPNGGAVFLNNCRPRRHPAEHNNGVEVFVNGMALPDIGGLTKQDKFKMAGKKPLAIVSYEDTMPNMQDDLPAIWPKHAPDETVVIIYRSFLNWSASLLRKISKNEGYGPIARLRIMSVAFKNYAAALELVQNTAQTGVIPINYDNWFASDETRAALLSQLGLTLRDNTLGIVQKQGGGSSFQGREVNTNDLDTARRAELMAHEPEYQMLLWTAARDDAFMTQITALFPEDAKRLTAVAQNASIKAKLPMEELV